MSRYWVYAGAFVSLYVPILGSYQSNRLDGPRMRIYSRVRKREQSMKSAWSREDFRDVAFLHNVSRNKADRLYDLYQSGYRGNRMPDWVKSTLSRPNPQQRVIVVKDWAGNILRKL